MDLYLSIITISFNDLSALIKTMQSVDKQYFHPFEHIIVDGSTNSEIKLFLEKNPQPSYRKWNSEPDKGISDAFNKGITKSKGDVIHILNSGDYYADDDITNLAVTEFSKDESLQWLHGQYIQYVGDKWITTGKEFNPKHLYRGMHKVGHPTMFVRKMLYEKHGLFKLNLKFGMDYDFLIRISNEKFKYLDRPLVVFTPGGASNLNRFNTWKEARKIYRAYYKPGLKAEIWNLYIQFFLRIVETKAGKWLMALKNRKKITSV